MTINSQTRISTILRKSPHSLYAIVKLSPKFNKLRNPILRKVMAPRVNIEQAARIGGCTPQHFFDALKPLGFAVDENPITKCIHSIATEKPVWLIHADNKNIKLLDVRSLLENNQDVLAHILDSLKMLKDDEILCVLNTFEPTPLIKLLRKKGYSAHVEKMHKDEVFTYFKLENEALQAEQTSEIRQEINFAETLKKYFGKLEEIDVRHLEMPQPMLTILEKLTQLPEGFALFVNHKRLPVYLLPELHERGFDYCVKEIAEGDVKIIIHRK